jgi:hypothetical protein
MHSARRSSAERASVMPGSIRTESQQLCERLFLHSTKRRGAHILREVLERCYILGWPRSQVVAFR